MTDGNPHYLNCNGYIVTFSQVGRLLAENGCAIRVKRFPYSYHHKFYGDKAPEALRRYRKEYGHFLFSIQVMWAALAQVYKEFGAGLPRAISRSTKLQMVVRVINQNIDQLPGFYLEAA